MSGLLPLGFTTPAALAALLLLPAIWWLLRLIPPRPRQVAFPPTRLLADIEKREETPDKSPLWLTILRLCLAAALIIALAGPVWRPTADAPGGDGPLWLLIDNGWASAHDWTTRLQTAEQLIDAAVADDRPVLLVATADGRDQASGPQTGGAVLERLRALEPRPWSAARGELGIMLREAANSAPPGAVVWLSADEAGATPDRFLQDLADIIGAAELRIHTDPTRPVALIGARNDIDALTVTVVTDGSVAALIPRIRALDGKGLTLGEVDALIEPGANQGTARFELPVELRNDIARLEVIGQASAASVQMLDDRWRRRTVGLVSGASIDQAQPLLSPLYYLDRALSPFTELRQARSDSLDEAIPALIDDGASVLILADVGRMPAGARDAVLRWVEQGGVLVRFAGPRLAGGADDLIPTPLRDGDRAIGGSLSWDEPQPLAEFSENSPFAGLAVPTDVTVTRQVLAEPGPDLAERSWAVLGDGTPLVTAAPRGRGTLVLFHVSADTGWSNLPLSGAFVEMLRRIVALSASAPASGSDAETAGADAQAAADPTRTTSDTVPQLAPTRLLDGYGRLGPPPTFAIPISARGDVDASRTHPPGLYGTDDATRAVNLLDAPEDARGLDLSTLPDSANLVAYPTSHAQDLRPLIFLIALLLLFADAIAMIALRGDHMSVRTRLAKMTGIWVAIGVGLSLLMTTPSVAQDETADIRALDATLNTRLAYVLTGDPARDEMSRQGLYGLTRFLTSRTALEPEAPVGVDVGSDELAFFPLLYWPISDTTPVPGADTLARVDAFMRNGGTILFDTADQISSGVRGFGTSPSVLRLRAVLEGLDIPPLEPVPPDHVLTKAFYLLDTFPGRYAGSPLWVEAIETDLDAGSGRPVRGGDGVSPILITGNDFAAAWAIDETGTYLYPTVPQDPVQRDYAFRSGVNIVMYALTGNYKADQVHIPALLERLGQ